MPDFNDFAGYAEPTATATQLSLQDLVTWWKRHGKAGNRAVTSTIAFAQANGGQAAAVALMLAEANPAQEALIRAYWPELQAAAAREGVTIDDLPAP